MAMQRRGGERKNKACSHMMTSDSFFVYLPSNVNTEGQYPNNNAGAFHCAPGRSPNIKQ